LQSILMLRKIPLQLLLAKNQLIKLLRLNKFISLAQLGISGARI
jgi:hypothetical protein